MKFSILLKGIFISILFFQALHAHSQIEEEIFSYVDSSDIIVKNGKALLLKSLQEKDFNKAHEVYVYMLKHSEDGVYSLFSYEEELFFNSLMAYWNQWAELAKNINEYRYKYRQYYSSPYSINGGLYLLMQDRSDSLITLKKSIDPESRQMIDVYLSRFSSKDIIPNYSDRLRMYKRQYAHGKYTKFIRTYLPNPNFKGSLGFAMGATFLFPTGDLGDLFPNPAVFTISMDVNVNKVYTSLYFNGGSFNLKRALNASFHGVDTVFQVNEQFPYIEVGLKGGYFVLRNQRVQLAPYAFIGGASLKSDIYDISLNVEVLEYEIYNSFIYGFGVHTQVKLLKFKNRSYDYKPNSFMSLKVDAGYTMVSKYKVPVFDGNMFYLQATLIFSMGDD
jgi:hypothetical protein